MRKVLVIAVREYLAAVRTKSFFIGLLMMPILMGGGAVIQAILRKAEDKGEKRFAIIDRTPGYQLYAAIAKAAELRNQNDIFDPATGEQDRPKFLLERVEPSGESTDQQRYELSQQVLDGRLYGFLDIGSDVYAYAIGQPASKPASIHGGPAGEKLPDSLRIRYHSRTPQYTAFNRWAERIINDAIQAQRWAGVKQSPETINAILQPVPLVAKGLARMNPETGQIEDAQTSIQEAHLLVPLALVVVMFMIIMIGSTPLVASVLEEKTQRIAEVLLGSVQPFQLMMGKLLGMVGVSLTIVSVYLAGGYYAASYYGFADLLSPGLLIWYLIYLALAIMMYGSIFIAVGAACTTNHEAQSLLMPVILIGTLPVMVVIGVVQEPNSTFATISSFIPPATPMLMIARQAVPPGIPWWQPVLGVVVVLAATTACVYAAGRIFRVGLLMSGKGARFSDLARWVISG